MKIEPYYETKLGKLYHGCCLDILPQLDCEVDLVLTDPPYGINKSGQKEFNSKTNKKHNRKHYDDFGWDKQIPKKEIFDLLFGRSKNQIIWGANYFVEYLKPSMGWLFWDKGQELSMSDGELAYTSFQKALRKVRLNRVELLLDGAVHPTQKPMKLFKWCVKEHSKENDLILDPFLGSGTTAVAAESLNRRWIGIEKEQKYCDIAIERLKNEVQYELF